MLTAHTDGGGEGVVLSRKNSCDLNPNMIPYFLQTNCNKCSHQLLRSASTYEKSLESPQVYFFKWRILVKENNCVVENLYPRTNQIVSFLNRNCFNLHLSGHKHRDWGGYRTVGVDNLLLVTLIMFNTNTQNKIVFSENLIRSTSLNSELTCINKHKTNRGMGNYINHGFDSD